MIATAFVFSACSNDDVTPPSDNGAKTGMILKATVAGQDESTRAAMDGDSVGSTNWKFDFDSNDQVSVSNNTINNYYTFTKSTDNFVSAEARTTATAADWYAYFPSNDVSLANQDGSFEKVANYYAMAGKTGTSTTGADGLSITMSPQVAILRVVKVEKDKFGPCDINVRTADGKYIAGLTAKKNEAGFDIKTSNTKVTYLSKATPGVYYIAVPAGVLISIYNGDKLRNKTQKAGLTAGKYYTVLTGPIQGTEEATINGKTVPVGWVQMYPGGEKIATQNVASKLTWADAMKTGDDYVWGKNWRTPTADEMNITGTNPTWFVSSYSIENNIPAFTFTGTFLGYTKNKLYLHANSEKSKEGYGEAVYWSATEAAEGTAQCLQMLSYGNPNNFFWLTPYAKTNTYYVRPIVNE